jgi:hypothetical protein
MEWSAEAFRQMAQALGLETSEAHLAALESQVRALWGQMRQLEAVVGQEGEPETVFHLGKE